LPVDRVAQVVRDLPRFDDPDVVIGLEGSSDAGVYRLRDDVLIVQSLDFFPPLVDDPYVYGQIAATNSLSDIYAMGGAPRTALNIVGFPDDRLELEVLHTILRGGAQRIHQAGAALVGGHTVRDTEVKYGLSVTGTVQRQQLITNRGARPGDALVLTKALGTGFVTTAHRAGKCPVMTLAAAVESMIQLNDIGRDAAVAVAAQAATDITGFGLAVHALELAQASGVTCVLDIDCIPCLPGVAELVRSGYQTRASDTNRAFALQHARLEGKPDATRMNLLFDAQTSGGLLISVAAERADDAVHRAVVAGARAAAIVGKVEEKQDVDLILRGPRG
jgi:selenide,water dikinase